MPGATAESAPEVPQEFAAVAWEREAAIVEIVRGRLQASGPVSVATVDVIKAVRLHAGLTLPEAKAMVDRCAFEGETVTIAVLSDLAANELVEELRQLPDAPPINVQIVDS